MQVKERWSEYALCISLNLGVFSYCDPALSLPCSMLFPYTGFSHFSLGLIFLVTYTLSSGICSLGFPLSFFEPLAIEGKFAWIFGDGLMNTSCSHLFINSQALPWTLGTQCDLPRHNPSDFHLHFLCCSLKCHTSSHTEICSASKVSD